jgi:hypothetical protein
MSNKVKLHLEDHGQDFLWFVVEGDKVIEAGPFQNWLWAGKRRAKMIRAAIRRETAWLIERNGRWYAAGPASRYEWQQALVTPDLWTADANKAIRFARKEDAETMIRFEGLQNTVATEHIWTDGR